MIILFLILVFVGLIGLLIAFFFGIKYERKQFIRREKRPTVQDILLKK